VARGLQMSPMMVGVRLRNIYRKLQFDCATKADGLRPWASPSEGIGLDARG